MTSRRLLSIAPLVSTTVASTSTGTPAEGLAGSVTMFEIKGPPAGGVEPLCEPGLPFVASSTGVAVHCAARYDGLGSLTDGLRTRSLFSNRSPGATIRSMTTFEALMSFAPSPILPFQFVKFASHDALA